MLLKSNIYTALYLLIVAASFIFSSHSAYSHTVYTLKDSPKGVAKIVGQILPYTQIPKGTKVRLRSRTQPIARIFKRGEDIRVHYNKEFDDEKVYGANSLVAIDLWMLLAFKFAQYDNVDPIDFIARLLALEGISRSQIEHYANKIKASSIAWLNEDQLKELLLLHQEYRFYDVLSMKGQIGDPNTETQESPVMEEPVMEAPVENSDEDESDLGAGSGAESLPLEPEPVVVESVQENYEPFEDGGVGEANNSIVKVYYATNRKKVPPLEGGLPGFVDPNDFFGKDREDGDKINYGYTLVNIPKIHEKGELERPGIVRVEFWKPPEEDPDQHIMLTKIEELNQSAFFGQLKEESKTKKTAFVFVHGFNVEFASAARVVGQLSYDSEFAGTPILFSWPSDGNPASYVADLNDAEDGAYLLTEFLYQLVEEGGYEVVNLVAHSMGNYAMTEALSLFERDMSTRLGADYAAGKKPFRELVMYAPDVDVKFFTRNKRYIQASVEHISVYASNNDKAITLSAKLRDYPRLGGYVVKFDSPKNCRGGLMYTTEGVDSIDATDINLGLFSPLNHSYYSEYKFLDDFGKLMSGDRSMQDPKNRGLGDQINQTYDDELYQFWGFLPCE